MPDRHRFFLPDIPFELLARRLAQDENFRSDISRVLELEEGVLARLAGDLADFSGFLDRPSIHEITRNALGDGELAGHIAEVVERVARFLQSSQGPLQEAMHGLAVAIREDFDESSQAEREEIIKRVRSLAAEPLGLAKQLKARQLVDATGAKLRGCQVICDIRPIFDQDRQRIEGAVPLSILRLQYDESNDEPAVVEMRITEGQLQDIAERVSQAQRKLSLIKQLMTSRDVAIPRTRYTSDDDS